MNWLHRLLHRAPSHQPERWVVLDVETSGLDTSRDALLAIAAIGLRVDWKRHTLHIDLNDSFEVILEHTKPVDKANILLHGIGRQSQQQGTPVPIALTEFLAFCDTAPLLAFHAAFDRAMLLRYCKAHQLPLKQGWLDIEQLCAVTHSSVRARALDEWLAHFGIECTQRHQAAADTLAECELLQRIWPQVAGQCQSWRGLRALAHQHRWTRRA